MLVYQRVTSTCCWLKPFYNGYVSVYWCQYLSVISPTDHKQMAANHLPGQPNDLKFQIIHDSSLEWESLRESCYRWMWPMSQHWATLALSIESRPSGNIRNNVSGIRRGTYHWTCRPVDRQAPAGCRWGHPPRWRIQPVSPTIFCSEKYNHNVAVCQNQ